MKEYCPRCDGFEYVDNENICNKCGFETRR